MLPPQVALHNPTYPPTHPTHLKKTFGNMMTPEGPLPPDDENMCRVVGSCNLSTRHKSSIADPSVTSPPSVLPLPPPSSPAFIPLFPDSYLLPSIYPLFFLSRPPQLSTSSLHPPIRNKFFFCLLLLFSRLPHFLFALPSHLCNYRLSPSRPPPPHTHSFSLILGRERRDRWLHRL